MIWYLVVAAVAMLVAFGVTPVVRVGARRFGIIAVPDDRKVHQEPTPESGGVAIFAGVAAALVVAASLPAFRALFRGSKELLGIGVAALIITFLGVLDDRRDIRPGTKLAGQLVASGILVLSGVEVVYFWFPGLGVISLSADLSALFTIIWTLAVINAMNLIDGLDGLAAGITAIAGGSLVVYAASATPGENTPTELLMVIVVAACVGFLPHNFHPASIFMGDAGSMLLGLLLASGTVLGFSRTDEPRFVDVTGFVVPVLLPVLVLAIPLVDALIVMAKRLRGGRPVFHGDKEHLHHRLFDMTQSHRAAVGLIYLWTTLLATASVSLAIIPGVAGRVTATFFALMLFASMVLLPRRIRRHGAIGLRKDSQSVPPEPTKQALTREDDVSARFD